MMIRIKSLLLISVILSIITQPSSSQPQTCTGTDQHCRVACGGRQCEQQNLACSGGAAICCEGALCCDTILPYTGVIELATEDQQTLTPIWTADNPAQWQYDGWIVSLSGLIRYMPDNVMGRTRNGLIGEIVDNEHSPLGVFPTHNQIFTASNGFGLDLTIEVRTNGEIYLIQWSVPKANYETGARPIPYAGQSFWILNDDDINAANPAQTALTVTQTEVLHNVPYVFLDGISYIAQGSIQLFNRRRMMKSYEDTVNQENEFEEIKRKPDEYISVLNFIQFVILSLFLSGGMLIGTKLQQYAMNKCNSIIMQQ